MLALAYGIICYALFFGTFLYAIGFTGNLIVPKGIDSGATSPYALAVNLGLLAVFAVQHSVMARPAFKRWWTRFTPQQVERSTYVLATSVALILLFWLWQPMPAVIWNTAGPLQMALWIVLARLADRAHFDVLHQSFRPVRVAAGLSPCDRPTVCADQLSLTRSASMDSSSNHAGFHHRFLGNANDDHGTPAVRGRHDGLHPAGDSIGGARFGELLRRRISRISAAGWNARSGLEVSELVKIRESEMPAEDVWGGFFSPEHSLLLHSKCFSFATYFESAATVVSELRTPRASAGGIAGRLDVRRVTLQRVRVPCLA
jgi:hypothetical protein